MNIKFMLDDSLKGRPVSPLSLFETFYKKVYPSEPFPRVEGKMIPRIIHRFWAGGKIGDSDFDNLVKMQERLNERNKTLSPREEWVQILWTSEIVNSEFRTSGLQDQFNSLKHQGLRVMDYERCTDEGKIPSFAELAKADKIVGIKHLSDAVRLWVLLEYGGTYMDLDIGPGTEKFEQDLYHRKVVLIGDEEGYMPLLGSFFPFILKPIDLQKEREGFIGGDYRWNYYFSTIAGNPFIKRMWYLSVVEKKDAQDIMGDQLLFQRGEQLFKDAFTTLELQFVTRGSIEKDQV